MNAIGVSSAVQNTSAIGQMLLTDPLSTARIVNHATADPTPAASDIAT